MINEVVGLIGAGKTTMLSKLLEGEANSEPVAVDLEDEPTLHKHVLPLLEKVYACAAGDEKHTDFMVEALFAILRCISLKATLLPPSVDLASDKMIMHKCVDELVEKLQLKATFVSMDEIVRLKAFASEAIHRHRGKAATTFIDRGLVDVLCFMVERFQSGGENQALSRLFFQIWVFIAKQMYVFPEQASIMDLFVNLKAAQQRCNYIISYKQEQQSVCSVRIIQRGREQEVSPTGEVRPRVLEVNENMERIYTRIFKGQAASTLTTALVRVLDAALEAMGVNSIDEALITFNISSDMLF